MSRFVHRRYGTLGVDVDLDEVETYTLNERPISAEAAREWINEVCRAEDEVERIYNEYRPSLSHE